MAKSEQSSTFFLRGASATSVLIPTLSFEFRSCGEITAQQERVNRKQTSCVAPPPTLFKFLHK